MVALLTASEEHTKAPTLKNISIEYKECNALK
jgi:hypothetical protein